MMVNGKCVDEAGTDCAIGSAKWDESWVSGNYSATNTPPTSSSNGNKNNARGVITVYGGGRGICVPGWHVPTYFEWAYMFDKVDGNGTNTTFQTTTGTAWRGSDAGQKLKSAGTYTGSDPADGRFYDHANRGTDLYQFSLLPTGFRHGYTFFGRGSRPWLHSSSVYNSSQCGHIELAHDQLGIQMFVYHRYFGQSVRCVRD
jgi:uncharacterized protein (TIGR02145 family)